MVRHVRAIGQLAPAAIVLSLLFHSATAQNYPERPIRLITSPVGGSSDFASRLIAPGLSAGLKQQVIVDNRGGGVLAVEVAAQARPDGYTLLYYGSTLWLIPLMQETTYQTFRDFTPVSMVVNSPVIVAVNPSVPVKSIKDLIALAKAKPGVLNYSSASSGSPSYMGMELLKQLAGIDIVRVPYKGAGPALAAVISGEVQVFMTSSGSMTAPISAGRIRALAVAGAKRSPSFPDLPTVAEAGVPGYEYTQMSGIFAPAKTPAAIIKRLHAEIVRVVHLPEIKERFFNAGADVEGNTPQEAAAAIKSDIVRLGKLIKDANIRGDGKP